jgi:hypothetical protein
MTSAIVRYLRPCGIGGVGGRVAGTVDTGLHPDRSVLATRGSSRAGGAGVTSLGGVGKVVGSCVAGCGRLVVGSEDVTDRATGAVVVGGDTEVDIPGVASVTFCALPQPRRTNVAPNRKQEEATSRHTHRTLLHLSLFPAGCLRPSHCSRLSVGLRADRPTFDKAVSQWPRGLRAFDRVYEGNMDSALECIGIYVTDDDELASPTTDAQLAADYSARLTASNHSRRWCAGEATWISDGTGCGWGSQRCC